MFPVEAREGIDLGFEREGGEEGEAQGCWVESLRAKVLH